MENKYACKDREMALAIIHTITEVMKAGTQKNALESVAEWLIETHSSDNIIRLTHEQREAKIIELLTSWRDHMTEKQRKEMAAFYLVRNKGIGVEGFELDQK
jgi:hypothetical protein